VNLLEVLGTAIQKGGGNVYEVPAGWMQGRTAYGGLTTALSLHAARALTGEDRALRSGMVSFVGPSAQQVHAEAELLRRGRNVSAVRTRLSSGQGVAVESVWTFADGRQSALDHEAGLKCPASPPPPDFVYTLGHQGMPVFMRNFELLPAGGSMPFSGGEPEQCFWVRHGDPAVWDHPLSLYAVADALAPAIVGQLTAPVPLSSMTWMIDLLVDEPRTERGWWLLRSVAEHGRAGYSTQDMTIWNAAGEPVAKGRQMVAVYA
jgi:acyl-CoA thioesterase